MLLRVISFCSREEFVVIGILYLLCTKQKSHLKQCHLSVSCLN